MTAPDATRGTVTLMDRHPDQVSVDALWEIVLHTHRGSEPILDPHDPHHHHWRHPDGTHTPMGAWVTDVYEHLHTLDTPEPDDAPNSGRCTSRAPVTRDDRHEVRCTDNTNHPGDHHGPDNNIDGTLERWWGTTNGTPTIYWHGVHHLIPVCNERSPIYRGDTGPVTCTRYVGHTGNHRGPNPDDTAYGTRRWSDQATDDHARRLGTPEARIAETAAARTARNRGIRTT